MTGSIWFFRRWMAVAIAAGTLAGVSTASAQQAFKTPEAAAAALVEAARTSATGPMLGVLGLKGRDIVFSGDEAADAADRERFLSAYQEKHQVTVDGDKATLIVGQNDFPFPIPLVRKNGDWRFDTEAGRKEIVARRLGRNELDAIQVSLAYVDAQNEYASKDRTGAGVGSYAQRVASRPGKRDGLYWGTGAGEEASPLGALAAQAEREGYKGGQGKTPYHGYFYKILKRQGPAAPGGSMDYVVGGKMIGGFALLAYPAEYGNSGVMSFIVNQDGTVYQKDLGPRTSRLATRIRSYDPDKTWEKVSVPQS
ncbi:DUF2950 domain-containing protein [Bosea sp. BIWAKO-01]|uniref:DUF2950 domain-containing protein n=1 Tax=Bosea sp. BIWAKO-01 TaxID=506668 RepID=UPI00085372AF|nr:DUF2950 domain-containing protein [Bosea sp. BIWAKO-01]GAU85416.1 hypothetical protein BIWAKO_05363 [Bosea sp. BIWAKO-01]